ncbi:MAG TPA: response regulator transcription factor [Candidatus Eisenbacteria bacterium]|nr:response regulator transcription factor [Candidatus Eisenbacteria bacterium]
MRVLIAEDDSELAEVLATGLRRENMAVDIALTGDAAEEKLTATDYDVLVLDRDLPGTHGDDVCRQVVASGIATRILMLTAAGSVGDRVAGLTLGADDYLAKPFAFAELVARIRALARRAHAALPPLLAYADLLLDPSRLIAERSGQRLRLTPKEFSVLEVLLGARGGVVTTEQLLERVWDENADPFTNTVRTTMMRLRQKLGQPALIRTVPGRGYQMASE